MDYSEQLKSPKWQKKRLEILQRDNFTCQSCGDTESQLQVHHITYFKNTKVWEYEDILLTTLCSNCHKDITYKKSELKAYIDIGFQDVDSLSELCKIIINILKYNPMDLLELNNFILSKNK